ncbi:hypothetical protein [Microbacterium sp. NPDC087592]|uniref:hypothetical protein n=1 Tax=Microbacterium sp. NPDC087592 TaxID=3364193 RepID=UPI003818ACF2
MHMFMVDETNRDYVEGHFFIVGGLVFTPEHALAVDRAVSARRAEFGYRPGDNFKFNTNERPAYVTPDQHREVKRLVIADLKEIGVRMIVSVVLHDLCRDQPYDTRMDWGLNTLAGAYRKLLVADRAHGIMLIDRDNDRFDHLEYLFQHGLRMFSGDHIRVHDRIKLFGMTNDNASNLSSAADIALGAFRYCVNTAVGAGREPVARVMFPDLAEVMWGVPVVGEQTDKQIAGYGYHARPKTQNITVPWHKERYFSLAAALTKYSLDLIGQPQGETEPGQV